MNRRSKERILVTGGTGFVGSHLVESYLESGMAVRVVGRSQPESCASKHEGQVALDFVELDLCDLGDNLEAFADRDLVVHTAAMLHANTAAERALQERVNVDATRNVIEACLHNEIPRLIHVSTTAAIGISADPTVVADETFPFGLEAFELGYNHTKHRAERLVLDADGPELSTIVVNPGFIFGPHRGRYRGEEVIERVRRRRYVLCTNGGLSIVHVEDVVDGIRRVAERAPHGQRYILSGENLSFQQIARTVSRVSGQRKLVITVPDAARDLAGLLLNSDFARHRGAGPQLYLDRRYAYQYYSSEKARVELGYDPRSFASIVADALAHMQDPESGPTIRSAHVS